jgi:hypothetical protein
MNSLSTKSSNPKRRPDWRFERVLNLIDRFPRPGRGTRHDDDYTKQARKFVLAYRNSGGGDDRRWRLEHENPGLFMAYMIYIDTEAQHELPFSIECRVLAGQTPEEIARECHTITDTILWYERLFFDVRDKLDALDYIQIHVLAPEFRKARERFRADQAGSKFTKEALAESFWDAAIKLFSYHGGRYAVDYFLSGFLRGVKPNSQEEVANWTDEAITLYARRRMAFMGVGVGLNQYNSMEYAQLYTRLLELQRAAAKDSGAETTYEKNLEVLLKDIAWSVGTEGAELVAGTPIALLDEGAAEPRADELMRYTAGDTEDAKISEIGQLTMPPPPMPAAKEDSDEKA